MEKEILAILQGNGYNVIPQYIVTGIPFIYDFYFPSRNAILEVQGDYYHANPAIYKPGTLIKMAGIKDPIYVDYLWKRDKFKKACVEDLGIRMFYLWERDYKAEGIQALNKCLSLIMK